MSINTFYTDGEEQKIYLEIEKSEDQGASISFSQILRAEQKRIAQKYTISEFNIFELLSLYAPVHSKINGIVQKFRFNKIIFYINEKLKKEYGNSFKFDTIHPASSGPIPDHLTQDITELREKGLIETYIIKDRKKIPNSDRQYEEMMKKKIGSGVVELTDQGMNLSIDLWKDVQKSFGDSFLEIIRKTKQQLIYLDTEELKKKVHKEYPEWQNVYTDLDTEIYF